MFLAVGTEHISRKELDGVVICSQLLAYSSV